MEKPLGNEDLSSKPGERVIDKPELPAGGITNENDVYTEVSPARCSSSAATSASSKCSATNPRVSAARTSIRRR